LHITSFTSKEADLYIKEKGNKHLESNVIKQVGGTNPLLLSCLSKNHRRLAQYSQSVKVEMECFWTGICILKKDVDFVKQFLESQN